MVKKLEIIKDFLGNNFIGIKYHENELKNEISNLKDLLDDNYELYNSNRIKRDGDNYYIIVVDNSEYTNLITLLGADKIAFLNEQLLAVDINDIKFNGIGKTERNENNAYYVIVVSEFLSQFRKDYNLTDIDLSITLGFNPNDVYGTKRDLSTLVKNNSKFLKLLKKLFYNSENWNFLKDKVGNLSASHLKVIKITDDYIFIESDKYISQIGLLDNGNLWVFCQYPTETNERELTQVEVRDILKTNI